MRLSQTRHYRPNRPSSPYRHQSPNTPRLTSNIYLLLLLPVEHRANIFDLLILRLRRKHVSSTLSQSSRLCRVCSRGRAVLRVAAAGITFTSTNPSSGHLRFVSVVSSSTRTTPFFSSTTAFFSDPFKWHITDAPASPPWANLRIKLDPSRAAERTTVRTGTKKRVVKVVVVVSALLTTNRSNRSRGNSAAYADGSIFLVFFFFFFFFFFFLCGGRYTQL